MIWVVEMECGCFQGYSLRELANEIADFYVNDNVDQVTDIHWVNNQGICSHVSPQGIKWFQDKCETIHELYQQDVLSEHKHQEQLRSDYYASVL